MTAPTKVLRLDRHAFRGAVSACLGKHIAAVVSFIGEVSQDLTWYAADVQVVGPAFIAHRQPAPTYVGDTATMVRVAAAVDQFESAVLVAVPRRCTEPKFRPGGLWTEDDEMADMGDAVVEVRAFDTTYISIATYDVKLLERIATRTTAGLEPPR